jgi:hypothetical protein
MKGGTHSTNDFTDSFLRLAMPRYCVIESGSVSQAPDAALCMLRQDRIKKKKTHTDGTIL